MKIKTSDLKDIALDFMAAKAGGGKGDVWNFIAAHADRSMYHYSTDWARGGPIIEREGIDLRKRVPDPDIARPHPRFAWKAELVATNPYFCGTGPTPLVAAMRCFVASKLGDEVALKLNL